VLPALRPLVRILQGSGGPDSPADLMATLLENLQQPRQRVPFLADAESSLKAAFPDRADELLAALKRLLPQLAKELVHETLTDESAEPGLPLAEVVASLATRLEDRQPGGARYRWTARQRGVSLEIVRETLP
jgi:hypothetical protein